MSLAMRRRWLLDDPHRNGDFLSMPLTRLPLYAPLRVLGLIMEALTKQNLQVLRDPERPLTTRDLLLLGYIPPKITWVNRDFLSRLFKKAGYELLSSNKNDVLLHHAHVKLLEYGECPNGPLMRLLARQTCIEPDSVSVTTEIGSYLNGTSVPTTVVDFSPINLTPRAPAVASPATAPAVTPPVPLAAPAGAVS